MVAVDGVMCERVISLLVPLKLPKGLPESIPKLSILTTITMYRQMLTMLRYQAKYLHDPTEASL